MAKTKPLPIPHKFNLAARGIESLETIARFSNDITRVTNLLLGGVHPDGACAGLREALEPMSSPLMLAAANSHPEIIKALLRAGANPLIIDPYGFDALTYAAHAGSSQSIQALLDHADFSIERLRPACLAATLSHAPSCSDPIAAKLRVLLERTDLAQAAPDPLKSEPTRKSI